MSLSLQNSTTKRLQNQAIRALDIASARGRAALGRLWMDHRRRLMGIIAVNYLPSSIDFNRKKPYFHTLIRSVLQQFHAESVPLVKQAVREIRRQSLLRHAWILDQVTPENITIALPAPRSMREADIVDNPSAFDARWASWLEAYNSALLHNLSMGAINEKSTADATSLVDATRANYPGSTLIDALNRIYEYEAMGAVASGAQEIGALNAAALDEEVWRTRGDLRVCDDCDANEGASIEDTGFPPLHPNCHCYMELVPKSFADLLRSGNADDWALAADMERDGIVPSALVVRGDNGEIAGKAVIDFKQWSADQGLAVVGQ